MSISMDNFASDGHFATFDPHLHAAPRVAVATVQCRCCGFEPEGAVVPPPICPKCHGRSWERLARPRGILENADRYGD
ncbi:MAG: hypothetical protein ABSB42_18615 [Tepidisphaeraceae bacterium]|jgi:hypothetical protein